MSRTIQTPTQLVWLSADGIVHSKLNPHATVDLADAEEAVRAIGLVGEGRRRPVCVDISEMKFMGRDARNYFAGAETAKFESAAALIVRSPLTRAIGNFFMGLNKPLFPTRLFTAEADALQWLRTFIDAAPDAPEGV